MITALLLVPISAVASRQPDAIALRHDEHYFTYSQLEAYSNQIAAHLISMNIEHGESVALCLDRSIHAVAAMLGVFKAGAVFVPLDPAFPDSRLAYMIEDATIRTVLCAPHYESRFQLNQYQPWH